MARHRTVAQYRRYVWHKKWRPVLRPFVDTRYGYRCATCGAADDLSVDHIVPLSAGGLSRLDNLQLLCAKCNGAFGGRGIRYEPWPAMEGVDLSAVVAPSDVAS